jgi:hypothetical protein
MTGEFSLKASNQVIMNELDRRGGGRILFIGAGKEIDYLNDTIFHGLKELYGTKVCENADHWYLYDEISDEQKRSLYGMGMTFGGSLPAKLRNVISHQEIKRSIKERRFDYVIYGSIWRCHAYFSLVKRHYPKEKILIIDGEDQPKIHKYFHRKGIYFKRELTAPMPDVYPIGFGIPAAKIADSVPPKTHTLAYILPGELSTYIYDSEAAYYAGYAQACFGFTKKKGGWDCLRHYEIMANGCIPYFIDLEHCPPQTMHLYPKALTLETNRYFEGNMPDMRIINDYAQRYLDYMRAHLTTAAMARCMLDTAASAPKVGRHKFNLSHHPMRVRFKGLRCRP